jgi:ABC-type proline/glycine betaine transport system permease subunit
VAAVLALIGLEILLVLWTYELPARHQEAVRAGGLQLAPSILITNPKGPLCLLLLLVAAAIATVCRDIADVKRAQGEPAERRMFRLRNSLAHAYVMTGLASAVLLLATWGG